MTYLRCEQPPARTPGSQLGVSHVTRAPTVSEPNVDPSCWIPLPELGSALARNTLISLSEPMVMRRALVALTLLVLAGCGNSTDNWAHNQAKRLTQAGVTYPPEQERNTVIALAAACSIRDVSDSEDEAARLYISTAPLGHDWISQADAAAMWAIADQEFCSSIPNGPLGEDR
jgi:hypothetical protein